jgi:hypothetical protein
MSIAIQRLAIAQAVSSWLPTAAARVRARVRSCGICGGQSGAGAGFLRVHRFPLPIFIPPIAPQSSSSIIWGLYNRPEVAAVPSGFSPTPQKKTARQTYIRVADQYTNCWTWFARSSVGSDSSLVIRHSTARSGAGLKQPWIVSCDN